MFGLNGDWRLSAPEGIAEGGPREGVAGHHAPLTRGRRTPRWGKGDPFEDVRGRRTMPITHHDQEHGSTRVIATHHRTMAPATFPNARSRLRRVPGTDDG